MEGGVYMMRGIALETIYWYTLLICAGLAVLLIILEMYSILMAADAYYPLVNFHKLIWFSR